MKILIKVSSLETGMYYHRLYTPFEKMKDDYNEIDMEATPVTKDDKGNNLVIRVNTIPVDYIEKLDAIVFSREIDNNETIKLLKDNNVKIVFDIDDYWGLDKSHPLYKDNAKITKNTVKALKAADLVFTPTPYLTEECKKHNPNSYTIKTCINTEHPQWSNTTIDSSLIRFGWIGGIYHLQDIKLLTNSFIKLHSDESLKGKYQLCLGGFNSQKIPVQNGYAITNSYYWEIEKTFTYNYKCVDEDYKNYLMEFTNVADHTSWFKPYRRLWSKPIEEYGSLYDELDVCLVPLSGLGNFNQYKSELKLIEAGTKGKMCIVSRVKPYTLIPDECVHFINPGDVYGWYDAIKYCIENPDYVKQKAKALQEYIKTNYVLSDENELRYELIKQICE